MAGLRDLAQRCPACGRPFWIGSAVMGVCSDACARMLRGNVDISEQDTRGPRFRELDRLIDAGHGRKVTLEGSMILDRLLSEWERDSGTDDVGEELSHA